MVESAFNVRFVLKCSVPMPPLPAARTPPDCKVVAPPIVPVPLIVALVTVTVFVPIEPLTASVPPETAVAPL